MSITYSQSHLTASIAAFLQIKLSIRPEGLSAQPKGIDPTLGYSSIKDSWIKKGDEVQKERRRKEKKKTKETE